MPVEIICLYTALCSNEMVMSARARDNWARHCFELETYIKTQIQHKQDIIASPKGTSFQLNIAADCHMTYHFLT